jgi:carboxyl-terminal processing protease
VGQTSWGKGLVQSVYTLPYGAALALTTSRYYTPSGRNIQRDYTSLFDYFIADPEPAPRPDSPMYSTTTGRKVVGGGGITPDVMIPRAELSRATQRIEAAGVLFDLGVEFARKDFAAPADVAVTDAMFDAIRTRTLERSIVTPAGLNEALAKPHDREYLRTALRAEIIAAKFGYQASYPVRVSADPQVRKAATLLPEAEKLARTSRDAAKVAKAPTGKPPVS